MKENSKFGTRAIHAGQSPDSATGAIMTPVYQTSTYAQSSPGKFIKNYDYSRSANPTRTALEANIASLEGGSYGIAFSSGCAALDATLHLLSAGDHVVLGDDVYGGTFRLFEMVYKQLGINYTMVDMTDRASFEAGFNKQTKLVWLETPTNPMLKLIDIGLASELAKKHGALLAVDNTFATPYLQTPLALGADIVSHSSTKYIGGHSDVVGGVLVTNSSELADKLHYIQNAVGAVPAPWDCFLLLRSTKTLHVRMKQHCENARQIASFLEGHSEVEKAIYPGLESFPQHGLAKEQMKDFGGMISMIVRGGLPKAKSVLEKVKIFSCAESLGGVESLIEHPAIMTHATIPKAQREALGIADGLIRLSVGIEDVDDLIQDLSQALA
ncbi:MAG: cystathionine gamma-synthase [Deltaproteobacteria bacterium]|nr:cystathionine gamma-synthase [Deltaproteobacteria bacterium]